MPAKTNLARLIDDSQLEQDSVAYGDSALPPAPHHKQYQS